MQYLIGALIMAVFFVVVLTVSFTAYKLGKKNNLPPPNEEEQRKALERQKAFQELMDYDVEKARQRKVNA